MLKTTFRRLAHIFITISLTFFLTACPGIGDSYRPHEATTIRQTAEGICFEVKNPLDYRVTYLSIAPRALPTQERPYTEKPDITLVNNQFCIPETFYPFPDEGQFIVDYTLVSTKEKAAPRRVIVGLELQQGQARVIPLREDEI